MKVLGFFMPSGVPSRFRHFQNSDRGDEDSAREPWVESTYAGFYQLMENDFETISIRASVGRSIHSVKSVHSFKICRQ